jgi:hypothetical protein
MQRGGRISVFSFSTIRKGCKDYVGDYLQQKCFIRKR